MTTRSTPMVVLASLLLLVVSGCGGKIEPASITIEPSSVVLTPGQVQVFTATVRGASSSAVEWSATGGSFDVSADGTSVEYTAPDDLGHYVLSAASVPAPSARAGASITLEILQQLRPDEDVRFETTDGAVSVEIPAGSVPEDGTLILRGIDLSTPIIGLDNILAGISATASHALEQLAIVSFATPDGGLDDGLTYQVMRREHESAQWNHVPSFEVNERIGVVTTSFSDYVIGVAPTSSYSRHFSVNPAFDPSVFGMHFDNDLDELEEDYGEDAIESFFPFSGICYGMSMTAGDYHSIGVPAPVMRSAQPGTNFGALLQAVPEALVRYSSARQNTQYLGFVLRVMKNWYLDPLNDYALVGEAQKIVNSVRSGIPAPVGIGASWFFGTQIGTGHVVLAYEATESYNAASDTLELSFTVYDPNLYDSVSSALDQHSHTPGRIAITVEGYERGKQFLQRPTITVEHTLNWAYRIGILFGMRADYASASLPWSNPVLEDLEIAVNASAVTLRPIWSHPNPEAEISRFILLIERPDGERLIFESWTPSHPDAQFSISTSRLGFGTFVVLAMAEDAQGNWSNSVEGSFDIDAGAPGTRITSVELLSPNGTTFRPREYLEVLVTVETDLDSVYVGARLVDTYPSSAYRPARVSSPGGSVVVQFTKWYVPDLNPRRFDALLVTAHTEDSALESVTVPVDYTLAPQEVDLWLGRWSASVVDAIDATSEVTARVSSVLDSASSHGTVEVRTYNSSGDVDFTASGYFQIAEVNGTEMSGTLVCTSATGRYYEYPVTRCLDVWTQTTSPFSVERTSLSEARMTIDMMAAYDPAFTRFPLTKWLP